MQELDAAGTSFDLAAFQDRTNGYSDDPEWSINENDVFSICIRESGAKLTPRQQAVYTYACMKWCIADLCDQKQLAEDRLDDQGKQRQAVFLNGDCPASPANLLDAFKLVTGRSWAECSQAAAAASDDYAAAIAQVACLLQDFKTATGNVDFASLTNAINGAKGATDSTSTYQFNKIVELCSSDTDEISTEEFVQCWAGYGVYSCAFMEANYLAYVFPDSCTVTL